MLVSTNKIHQCGRDETPDLLVHGLALASIVPQLEQPKVRMHAQTCGARSWPTRVAILPSLRHTSASPATWHVEPWPRQRHQCRTTCGRGGHERPRPSARKKPNSTDHGRVHPLRCRIHPAKPIHPDNPVHPPTDPLTHNSLALLSHSPTQSPSQPNTRAANHRRRRLYINVYICMEM